MIISINTNCYQNFIKKITQNKFSKHGISTIRNLWSNKYIKYTIILSTLILLIRSGFNKYKKNKFIRYYKNNGGNELNKSYLERLPCSEINKIESLAVKDCNSFGRLPEFHELIKFTNSYIEKKIEKQEQKKMNKDDKRKIDCRFRYNFY